LNGCVEASIVYCSGRDRYVHLLPDATLVAFPPQLQVAEYALAVLKDAQPGALMLALTILSPAGQKILAEYGFRPVGLPSEQ
jgi:molybdate transport system substrate-binding protein